MSRTAVRITLDACEQALLEKISRQLTVPEYKKERIQIVLAAASGQQNKEIAAQHNLERHRVSVWRNRWAKQHQDWKDSDSNLRPKMDARLVMRWLDDEKGRGRKPTITLEQRSKIAGLCQETPEQNDIPVTHWTLTDLAKVAAMRGVVDKISRTSVHRILKKTTCRPTAVGTG
jgi:transposase